MPFGNIPSFLLVFATYISLGAMLGMDGVDPANQLMHTDGTPNDLGWFYLGQNN